MKIVSVGGGPAGLYFSILIKRILPGCDVTVVERNRPDDTFGFGVVFSDETLGNFEAADPATYRAITGNFIHWQDIETYYPGECTVSTGHGFSALSRKRLLLILQERCRELGVKLEFEREVVNLDEFADADLILGADGVKSLVRDLHQERFRPHLDWRECRFCWLGTDKPLDAFTFIFEPTEHGLFQVHAYPFEENTGTQPPLCTQRRPLIAPAVQKEITRQALHAFFDAYLKGDAAALARLEALGEAFDELTLQREAAAP